MGYEKPYQRLPSPPVTSHIPSRLKELYALKERGYVSALEFRLVIPLRGTDFTFP